MRLCVTARFIFILSFILALPGMLRRYDLPLLKISDNHRYIVTADDKPFFYVGNTAWE